MSTREPPSVDQARGALLGTFVGDALGMPFEGQPPAAIPRRLEMLDARLGRGTYTDDTQMTIALAESLLERGRVDEDHLGGAFLTAYDPRRGYGAGTRQVGLPTRMPLTSRNAAPMCIPAPSIVNSRRSVSCREPRIFSTVMIRRIRPKAST